MDTKSPQPNQMLAVVVNGKVEIREYPRGVRPSNFCGRPPPGWGPEDSEYLFRDSLGRLKADHLKREIRRAAKTAGVDEPPSVPAEQSWNEDTVLGRMKKAFTGEKP